MAEITGAGLAAGLQEEQVRLGLPSMPHAPQSSPQLLRGDESEAEESLLFAPWKVAALSIGPAGAPDLLLCLPQEAPPGMAIGDSLRFLGEVAKLSLELVARGRVLPSLVRTREGFFGRWKPAYSEEGGRLGLLARAMPPVCRAGDGGLHEAASAGDIIRDMIGRIADAGIRQMLAGRPILAPHRGRRGKGGAASEAWLASLSADDPSVKGDEGELEKLRRQLDEWTGSAGPAAGSLRTCFRLSTPEEEALAEEEIVPPEATSPEESRSGAPEPALGPEAGTEPGPWRLEFLLQDRSDPSLMVAASAVWRSGRAAAKLLGKSAENPEERLLADLARAARLYPELESALRTSLPTDLPTDAAGAHRFLSEAAPLLEEAGFGVLVPPWWSTRSARLGVKLRVRPKGGDHANSGLLGLSGICAYSWEISLGDQTLSVKEFQRLARLKVPLVQARGRWVELRREDIQAALKFFEKTPGEEEMTLAQALRMGAGDELTGVGLPVVKMEAEGWLADLLGSNDNRRFTEVETPARFCGSLRPYQQRGLSWLWFLDRLGLGACLADDMGLGKTIQLLALLLAERERVASGNGGGPARSKTRRSGKLRPTLLVCPMSVVGNWQREAARFAPGLNVHVHHGPERLSEGGFARSAAASDLVITTYNLAARDRELLGSVHWERLVLDEAQNIKNAAAKQTQAIRALKANRRVALTGTPVENRLSELWSIMEFLNPGLLGGESDFHVRFAAPIERYRDEQAAARLRRLTGPFVLRRLKTDRSIISDLPQKAEMKVFCNLTKEQATLYEAVVEDMLEQIATSEGIKRRGLILSAMMKLKQICNHPAQMLHDRSALTGRSGKLARLEEIVEEILAEGDRALIFTQFSEMGQLLKTHLQERFAREILFLHGGVSKKARDEMVERFQGEQGPALFVLSVKAGGTGLNLTAANQVIHFDRWWNPAVEDQATDRAFRIGQRRRVQVRKFVCAGTLEERIDQMIESKKELAQAIVGSGEAWLTEFSTEKLRELVALSPDAVSEG